MMRISSWLANGLLVLVFLLCSCKPQVPYKYIQPDKMEDILYDYHIAEAISSDYEIPHDSLTLRAYRHAILEKYGCTDADFDSSLVYYTRHTERLHRIYENLSQRLSNTAISLGASLSDLNRYGSLSATGDTANIWNGDMSFVLMHHPAFNKYSFKIDADSTFHPGDKLQLHFNSQFIFQDGMRDAIVVLAIKLSNDSVISRNMHVSGSNSQSIEVNDDKRLGIKEVKGFFLLNNNINRAGENQTTMKLAVVNHISLVRMHTQEPEKLLDEEKEPNKDSVRIDSSRNVTPPPHQGARGMIGPARMPHEPSVMPRGVIREEVNKKVVPNNQLK